MACIVADIHKNLRVDIKEVTRVQKMDLQA